MIAIRILSALLVWLAPACLTAESIQDVRVSARRDLQNAVQKLDDLRNRIEKEKIPLVGKVEQLERKPRGKEMSWTVGSGSVITVTPTLCNCAKRSRTASGRWKFPSVCLRITPAVGDRALLPPNRTYGPSKWQHTLAPKEKSWILPLMLI